LDHEFGALSAFSVVALASLEMLRSTSIQADCAGDASLPH